VELFKEKEDVELFARYKGVVYPITKDDIINLLKSRQV